MAAKSIAVQGDITATPGSITTYNGAASGTWTAGPISYKTDAKVKIGGAPVIYEASCKFSFSGSTTGGSTVAGSETVTLTAGTTKLQKGAHNVLQDGDKVEDEFQNKLTVSSTRKLKSA